MKLAVPAAVLVTIWLGSAWMYMLLVGVLHRWWPLLPAMGFPTALTLTGIFCVTRFVAGGIAEMVKQDTKK